MHMGATPGYLEGISSVPRGTRSRRQVKPPRTAKQGPSKLRYLSDCLPGLQQSDQRRNAWNASRQMVYSPGDDLQVQVAARGAGFGRGVVGGDDRGRHPDLATAGRGGAGALGQWIWRACGSPTGSRTSCAMRSDQMRRYSSSRDPAVWAEFLKASEELKSWIEPAGAQFGPGA